MNRIEQALAALKEKKEKAFITYITAGLPDYEKTKAIVRAQEKAGTDIVELGIPFSDPAADGPVIQAASYEAIQNGATLEKTFSMMEELRGEGVQIPIVFMMYYNTVLHYGLEAFADRCRKTGVDGLIIPDLPLEEQEELQQALYHAAREAQRLSDAGKEAQGGDETILIQLVSPVSKARVPKILEHARGFVYCVSSMGVTGQAAAFHREVVSYLTSVKEQSKIPVMMGFGIRTAEDVRPMKDIIDGAIVGSHFIRLMQESGFDPDAAAEYCSTFKRELNALS